MAKIKTGPKVKRKGGGVAAKSAKVDALAEQIASTRAIVVTEYRGLTVAEIQDLRRRLRPKGVEYHVVKNSLLTRAAEKIGKRGIDPLLTGPTAVAFGQGDEVETAKSVVDELRAFRALKIVGAWVGGQAMGTDDVQALARLPGRPQLQATIVGSLQAPLSQMVGVLTAAQAQLVRVFEARAQANQ